MELKEIIKNRKSVRKYKDEEVPDEIIRELIDSARLAPSGKNSQNWHYIAIKNIGTIKEICDVIKKKNADIVEQLKKIDEDKANNFQKFPSMFTTFIEKAPLIFVVLSKDYIPTGYNELKLLGLEKEGRDDLISLRNPGIQGVGASIENLYLRANDLGYGLCWLTSANYAGKEIEKYLKDKNIFNDSEYYMTCLLSLGKQDGSAKSPPKLDIDDILTLVK